MLVLGKLQLRVLQNLYHILLLGDLNHAFILHFAHLLGYFFNLLLNLLLLGRILDTLTDVECCVQEVLVEVVREHWIGFGEVVTGCLVGDVFI